MRNQTSTHAPTLTHSRGAATPQGVRWLRPLARPALTALGRWATYLLFAGLLTQLVQGQDLLVGLTSKGGPRGGGTAFSLKTNGTGFGIHQALLAWGRSPTGDLVRGADGNFYGMTQYGGNYSYGTIFRTTPGGTITVLRHLNSTTDGRYPTGSLVVGSDGAFYGMTRYGGANASGTVFKITAGGTFTVLRPLKSTTDGRYPQGSLVRGTDGNFYGMTNGGGTNNYGTIFRISPGGATFTVLRHLSSLTDGRYPEGSLVQNTDGAFYGLTLSGGSNGWGTIFRITTGGTFTVLRHLSSATDGRYPKGSLVRGSDGAFYGTTSAGGTNGYGTIFRITASGATFSVLRHLSSLTDGRYPSGSLVRGSDGAFYGMAPNGGSNGWGTIFRITTGGSFSVLRHLSRTTDGSNPAGSLVQNTDGAFYGLTYSGGTTGYGTLFRITTGGSFSVLHHLDGSSQGSFPVANLVQGTDGNYYGTTSAGGTTNHGTVFRTCTNGSYAVLYSLDRTAHGGAPRGNLAQGVDGAFYGTTSEGGSNAAGTIFRITAGGALSVLRHLSSSADGRTPRAGLVRGTDGAFYGTTYGGGSNGHGTLFKITAGGTFTVLRHLSSLTDGRNPEAELVQGSDGAFYGTTYSGGSSGWGTIFRITAGGTFTVLRHLSSSTDGRYPEGSLIQGPDGAFYGVNSAGGSNSGGTIFRITAGGSFSVLRHLFRGNDGATPRGNLVRGSDGAFYGMTSTGGTQGEGTIFRITGAGTFTVLRHLNLNTDGSTPLGGFIIQKPNPVAIAQTVAATEDTPKTIVLSGTGGTPLTYTIVSPPANGTLTGSGANRKYTPKADFFGTDSFTFTVSWGCQTSAPKQVTIQVAAVAGTTPASARAGTPAPEGIEAGLSLHPNPVRETATLTFRVEQTQPVRLGVFDVQGNLLDDLFDGQAQAGQVYRLRWKAGDRPSGVYVGRLVTGTKVYHQKLVLQR
ncbi:MAG: T9SS type A sorting domain-containing protein [Cytophagales bacterium]|nr:T9SS type A sorting domain-containing protein [Cytophagales bacterium]